MLAPVHRDTIGERGARSAASSPLLGPERAGRSWGLRAQWLVVCLAVVACDPSSSRSGAGQSKTSGTQGDAAGAVETPAPAVEVKKAPPRPSGATEADFARFLPEDVRGLIVAGLRRIPFDKAGLDRLPTLHFISSEAAFPSFSDGRRIYVRNKGRLVRHERFDYWLLHQTTEESDFRDTTRFVIVVDKSRVPRWAYYLQFDDAAVAPGFLPRPKGFTTSCFACHPGGPRVIRPQVSDRVSPPGPEERALLQEWNTIITHYREVETYMPLPRPGIDPGVMPELPVRTKPPPGYEVPLKELSPLSMSPFVMRACLGCHHSGSGVRSPLYRQNAESILMMLHYPLDPDHVPQPVAKAVHPFDELPTSVLTPFEQDCLMEWLGRETPPEGPNPGGECRDPSRPALRTPPPAPPKPGASLLLDVSRSHAYVQARTIFGDISVGNVGLSGALKCRSLNPQPAGCAATFMADVSVATTGIELRDLHLKEYLKSRQFPFVVIQLDDVGWDKVAAGGAIPAEVEVAGRPASYDVRVRCKPIAGGFDCALDEVELRLSRHGLQPYGYLGAVVEDGVKIKGRLTLVTEAG